jgi:hypothetical protein
VTGGYVEFVILEGIVTTLSPDDRVNVAPMGPRVDAKCSQFLLRPYKTSQTYQNLKAHGEGVFHVTDDALLLARAALGPVEVPLVPATKVRGFVLADCCRFFEFRVTRLDDRDDRTHIETEIVHADRRRDFFGFNRARHAIIEAAILATRTDFLPLDDIQGEYRKLAVIVDKTGGPAEQEAMALLCAHVAAVARSRGVPR